MTLTGSSDVRHIHLTDRHSANFKTSGYGESVGHYVGDTLVVDTIGLDDRTLMDGFGTPHTKDLHVIERFRLIDDGRVLEANIHVEDPGAFTTPWDAIQRFRQYEAAVAKVPVDRLLQLASPPEGPLVERSCADNPNSFFQVRPPCPYPRRLYPISDDSRLKNERNAGLTALAVITLSAATALGLAHLQRPVV